MQFLQGKEMQVPDGQMPGLFINLAFVRVSKHPYHVNLKGNTDDLKNSIDLYLGFIIDNSCSRIFWLSEFQV
jgi:hypothetical protein